MSRKAQKSRKTSETDISVSLELLTASPSSIASGVPFFDHMLSSMSRHGRMKLDLNCTGDTHIDDHHSVEDCGIVMGTVFKEALGDKKGIRRFGFASVPMDDALCQASVDLSGRAYFRYTGTELKGYIGKYAEELTSEFLYAFALNSAINVHINVLYGENRHHIHEAVFKSFGLALYEAALYDDILKESILSTKGVL